MDQMKPGPELDALIAEKVMGWTIGDFPPFKNCVWYSNGEMTNYWTTYSASQECPGFSPSTDIAAAWEVVEKLKSESIYITLAANLYGYKSDVTVGPGIRFETAAKTAPHAICLAALKAVGA